MSRVLFATLLASATVWAGTPKYAFPTTMTYPFGKNYFVVDYSADIQATYDEFVSKYYATCSDGSARIKWVDDTKNETGGNTVSEGIGYGMMIFVYMDNATNNTQSKFDNLWKYYKRFGGANGVMDWKIDGCNGTKEGGGATDGDLDVAFALLMAYKQWGTEQYLTDAKRLIGTIWDKEVDQGKKLLKPGNLWTQEVFNPSYFATGVLRIFQQVDPSHDWNGVADNCIALAKKNQNKTTGFNSDWCNANGNPQDVNGSGTSKFGYDAGRTPWRITLDYLWHGTKAAKEFETTIHSWVYKTTGGDPSKIRAEYSLDGSSATTWSSPFYSGALIMPGLTDSTNPSWIRKYAWEQLAYAPVDTRNYYNCSWRILYELTFVGAFQNFYGKMNSVSRHPSSIKPWSARSSKDVLTLEGSGLAEVDLVDAQGTLLGHGTGTNRIHLPTPRPGLYFAKIKGEHPQVLPVTAP